MLRKIPARVLVVVLVILLSLSVSAGAIAAVDVKPAMDRAVNNLLSHEKGQGGPLSPWSYVALAAAGQDLKETRIGQSCEQQLSTARATADYCLLVLTLLSAGDNPSSYRGQNLVQKIQAAQLGNGKFADNIDGSGEGDNGAQILVNAHIWAVLALHAAGAEIPDALKAGQWLIEQQHGAGSFNWCLADKTPDVDSTAMALMALGALGERADSPAVQKAITYLKKAQESNGGFTSWGSANAESCNMVIEGLTAVGIDPAGAEMSKPGGNPVSAILGFQLPDGSFEHIAGTGANEMATQQALMALSDIYYGKTLYDRLLEKSRGSEVGSLSAARKIQFKVGAGEYVIISGGRKKVEKADVAPFIENDRTYVPVRYLALALGVPEAGIRWSPSARTVTLINNGITITMAVGGNIMYVNDVAGQPMDVAPVIKHDRAFLPARYVAESMGYRVNWDGSTQTVNIDN